MPTRLIIIRHAESEANAEGRIQGHLDIPLSPLGLRQAACLADSLQAHNVDTLYSSPLKRAHQTADVVADRLALVVHSLPELRERDVGVLEGLNRQEILERFPEYGRPGVDPNTIKVEGFEQDGALTERVTTTLQRIVSDHSGQTVGIVTHGGVIGTVLRWLLNLPRVRPGPFVIENTSVTIIDVRSIDEDGTPHAQLVTLNDTCHLDAVANA